MPRNEDWEEIVEDYPGDQQRVPWKITDVAIATGVIFAAFLVLMVVLGRVLGVIGLEGRASLIPWFTGIFEGLMLVTVWIFGVKKYHAPWRLLGFRPSVGRRVQILPWVALLGSLLFTGLYGVLIDRLDVEILRPPPPEMLADLLGQGFTRMVNIAVIGVWGPFAEEVFFRGFLLAALVPTLGAVRAALLSSVIFAAAHLDIGTVVPIFVTGLLLAWLYLRTRSLWPSITAHVAQNILVLVVALRAL